jgi:hypothetical protein
MPNFISKFNKNINGFDISVYEVDLEDSGDMNKLKTYLKSKIKKMKIHNKNDYSILFSVPGINKDFSEKTKEKIAKICSPCYDGPKWLDAKRSRVTEFMSQCLLEKKQNCIFFDEADRRINLDPSEADKHSIGIDVTGIQNNTGDFKFIVCEVKATKGRIPCSEASKLLDDIKKGYNDERSRLSREILSYISNLNKITDDEKIKNILQFLFSLINDESSHNNILQQVVFFPFLIRNCSEIVEKQNLEDFRDFRADDFPGTTIKGIIWSFNTNIDDFCINLYDEAIK